MLELVTHWAVRMALLTAALVFTIALAAAQTEPKKSPFGVGPAPRPAAEATQAPAASNSVWGSLMAAQQYYHRQMAGAVRDLKSNHPLAAGATLAFISFVYGVLHAAGPGHGKAVISSYVLANRQTVRRGILLSFLSALFQALSAIGLVLVLVLAMKATSLTMKSAEYWIELVSWVAVAAVGLWLLVRQVRPLMAARAGHGHLHGHAHTHAHAVTSTSVPHQNVAEPVLAEAHAHDHAHAGCCGHDHSHDHSHHHRDHGQAHAHDHANDHVGCAHASEPGHVHDACCGHAHMPDPSQLQGPWSWSRAISLAATVGIRPCSGAILVLLFALSQGMLWAGILSTFVMALGTAITVSVLAALAVGSRELAVRMAGSDSGWAARLETGVGIAGALLVVLLGVAGFASAIIAPVPF